MIVYLQHFWAQYQYRSVQYGRLFTRCTIAEILFRACTAKPYFRDGADVDTTYDDVDEDDVLMHQHLSQESNEPHDRSTQPTEEQLHMHLSLWDMNDWTHLITLLKMARSCCIRKDSNMIITSRNQMNPTERKFGKEQEVFTTEFEKLLSSCEINQLISPIRLKLQNPSNKDTTDGLIEDVETFIL